METLISVSRIVYNNINGTAALNLVDTTSPAAVQCLLNPIVSSSINLKPTPQGTKVLYNTVSLVMPIIMQFFFLMAVNGVAGHFNLYSHLPLKDNGIIRLGLSTIYTFIGALCTVSYQRAFYESQWLSAGQFVLAWLAIWLYMHINFLAIDCLTAFVPMTFLSFFFFSWVILNITTVILPFQLNPGFYHWGYALPAYETLQVLITIWSAGGANSLHIALPVLFAWEIVLLPLSVLALHYRCANAAKEYDENEAAMQEKYAHHTPSTDTSKATEDKILERRTTVQNQRTLVSPSVQSPETGNGYFPSTPMPFQNTLERVMSPKAAK